MNSKGSLQVGAPDPELETSPILDVDAGESEGDEIEPGGTAGLCYFNGVTYRIGDYVMSGHEVLRCEAPGLWVRRGEVERTT